MTDEPTPVHINSEYLGANHTFPHAVKLYIENHGKDYADIGSLWIDREGTKFTLIDVEADILTVISENIGTSYDNYKFKHEPAMPLTYIENGKNTAEISSYIECWRGALQPIIKHRLCRVYAFINGKRRPVNSYLDCDYGEIHETYDIIHPVSMIKKIRENRPKDGYTLPIIEAVGEPMLTVSLVYRVESDGGVMVDFGYKRKSAVKFTRCMGAMFQSKLDVYGGGVYRYIPKSKKFSSDEGIFDFTSPYPLNGSAFPASHPLTSLDWENPYSPPDRIVDVLRDKEGNDRLLFACGYLPVKDGVPSVRKNRLNSAVAVVSTRKAYPMFQDGYEFYSAEGVAYKKYVTPVGNGKYTYSVSYNGKTYYYFDIFKEGEIKTSVSEKLSLIEKSEGIEYTISNGELTVSGKKGYAVFCSQE